MSSSKKKSKLSRKELISIKNELKTELNEYKNESKKRQKFSGSEALDRQTVNKKSFSDRICDDLCEEILQYLSLEDKLKLEGVSKQFQRTILKKQYELTIETDNFIPNRKVKKKFKYLYIENTFIDLKSLEVLLKKCPNITTIFLEEPDEDENGECDYNPVFRLITKYCNNLRQIKFWNYKITDKNIKKFQQKFGQKIKFWDNFKDGSSFNLFPNIEKLLAYYNPEFKQSLPQLKLKQLTELRIGLEEGEEHMVKTCVDTFPTLKHFDLNIRSKKFDSLYSSLDYISNLKHLIHFGFGELFGHKINLFSDSLKRMANKCQKLKSFEFRFQNTSETSLVMQLFSTLMTFPALKRLILSFDYDLNLDINPNISKTIFDSTNVFPFEAFKRLPNITHLTLQFNTIIDLNIFRDIDINLPKLQYLAFNDDIDATPEEVTQMADILSRLSRLQTLKLVFSNGIDFNEIEAKIREKCRKIRTIHIKHREYFWN